MTGALREETGTDTRVKTMWRCMEMKAREASEGSNLDLGLSVSRAVRKQIYVG